MELWTFDWGYFLGGIAILTAGILIVVFHQKIADNFASGVASYGKVKLFGLGACILGFILISQLHTLILRLLLHLIIPAQF